MSWWETLHLVTWWKRLGISAIKTGQDAPSWIWCTERLSFFGGGHIVLQRFVHVRCHFQPLPTKLVFAYFDRGSCVFTMCFFDYPPPNMLQQDFVRQHYDVLVDLVPTVYISWLVIAILSSGKLRDLASIPQVCLSKGLGPCIKSGNDRSSWTWNMKYPVTLNICNAHKLFHSQSKPSILNDKMSPTIRFPKLQKTQLQQTQQSANKPNQPRQKNSALLSVEILLV